MAKAFPQSAKPANTGGRPPALDWDVVKEEAIRLMDYHGEFREFARNSPKWNARKRLEDALEAFCETKFNVRPGTSTIQRRLKPWLDEWRKTKT